MADETLDCLIIGGGPAGLTAAIYLARFHLKVRVIDEGKSRAGWIPCTRNLPGFPDGLTGRELLARMRTQAEKYGTAFTDGRVTRLDRAGEGFEAEWGEGTAIARTVLIATGVKNRRPDMDEALHDEALARGLIRYCPICDGYEVTDRKIGVIGSGKHGVGEAVFLRSYSADITLIAPDKAHALAPADREQLERHGIVTVDGPSRGVAIDADCIVVDTADGHFAFDTLYPALGSDVHAELAEQIGVELSAETGCIVIDAHQRASVAGVYAAGDIVLGLDQLSHAMGEGGVAATTIRNDLAKQRPLMR
ncbi:MAG: NAD(P)/FAD-dependent oxidoreductase [Sphingosinicella sp.]